MLLAVEQSADDDDDEEEEDVPAHVHYVKFAWLLLILLLLP
jgi:hypothetical protein